MPSLEYAWVFSNFEMNHKGFCQYIEEKVHKELGAEIMRYLANTQKLHTIRYLPVVERPWYLDSDYTYRQWEVVISED